MRDIKFRAWDKEEQEMLDWDKFFNLDIAQVFESKGSWGIYPMQYTGLKDKNGVEIYEWDVVEADIEGILSCEVVFRNGRFTMRSIEDGDREYLWILNEKCKVIGNRFENPELLEGNR